MIKDLFCVFFPTACADFPSYFSVSCLNTGDLRFFHAPANWIQGSSSGLQTMFSAFTRPLMNYSLSLVYSLCFLYLGLCCHIFTILFSPNWSVFNIHLAMLQLAAVFYPNLFSFWRWIFAYILYQVFAWSIAWCLLTFILYFIEVTPMSPHMLI